MDVKFPQIPSSLQYSCLNFLGPLQFLEMHFTFLSVAEIMESRAAGVRPYQQQFLYE